MIMKKYLLMLPIMLYPYLYIIIAFCSGYLMDYIPDAIAKRIYIFDPFNAICYAVIVHGFVLMSLIFFLVWTIKGTYTASRLAKITMITKLVQIPAFIMHFVLGSLGLLASVWGIGVILWAIIIDLLTVSQTGLLGIFTCIRAAKEKSLSKKEAVVFAICNCIYVVDVVIAVIDFFLIRSAEKRQGDIPAATSNPASEPQSQILLQ